MGFNYRIIWLNAAKGRQEACDISGSSATAMFVAKKKVSEGMQDVVIQVSGDTSIQSDPNDAS